MRGQPVPAQAHRTGATEWDIRRPVFPHQGEGVAVLGAARDGLRPGVTAGRRRCRCVFRAARSPESFRALGRRSAGHRSSAAAGGAPVSAAPQRVEPSVQASGARPRRRIRLFRSASGSMRKPSRGISATRSYGVVPCRAPLPRDEPDPLQRPGSSVSAGSCPSYSSMIRSSAGTYPDVSRFPPRFASPAAALRPEPRDHLRRALGRLRDRPRTQLR